MYGSAEFWPGLDVPACESNSAFAAASNVGPVAITKARLESSIGPAFSKLTVLQQEELGRKQEELDRQQEALRRQQEELGHQQEAASRKAEKELKTLMERGWVREVGTEVVSRERRSPEYLQKFVESEIEKWAAPIKASGVSMD